MDWNTALKLWRAGGGDTTKGGIPKKGTPDYETVKRIQRGEIEAPAPASVKPDKPDAPKPEKRSMFELLLSGEVKPQIRPKKATAEDLTRMRAEAEEPASAPAPPKKSLAERLREAEEQDKREAEAKAKAKAEAQKQQPKMLELLMSGKVVKEAIALPKPQSKEAKLLAEAEARRAYFAEMAKQEEGVWASIFKEMEKTTKRPIVFKLGADYNETPDNPEQPPDPEGELYSRWEFRWNFVEPLAWYASSDERKEGLNPIRKWIIACLREEDILPYNTGAGGLKGMMTETLRLGYAGSPLYLNISSGNIDLPEDYPERDDVMLKAKAHAKDELLGTYAYKKGQPLRMGPPSHRAGFDKLIYAKGTVINQAGMKRVMDWMCADDYRKEHLEEWEEKSYLANTTEEERAEDERKKEEAEERQRAEERAKREAKYAEARIVAEKALKKHAESKKRLTSQCYDCSRILGGLAREHTVDKCPLRKSIYCYVCSRYGHSPKMCPAKVAIALRANRMPGKDVRDFELPVSSAEDVKACIVMAGEVPTEGLSPEDQAEDRRRLHTICDLLEQPHSLIFRFKYIFVKEKEDE